MKSIFVTIVAFKKFCQLLKNVKHIYQMFSLTYHHNLGQDHVIDVYLCGYCQLDSSHYQAFVIQSKIIHFLLAHMPF